MTKKYLVCNGPCSPCTKEFHEARRAHDYERRDPPGLLARILELGRSLVHTAHYPIAGHELWVCAVCGTCRRY